MTERRRDPTGKRALFSDPSESPPRKRNDVPRERPTGGASPWTITVHCSSCDTSTPLSVPGFLVQHVPVWAWLPWKRHAHLMRCPSCGRLSWHAVS